ncbi:MAG: hypothetical protein H6Q96_529, partial [Nitrospirae bacterium]|nr:hypothetical protein [Nitrospirota bacterium]
GKVEETAEGILMQDFRPAAEITEEDTENLLNPV